jgi:hypothetical protein
MPRRFPPPWTVIEENGACFIVKDHNGQALAYVYFEDEPGQAGGRGEDDTNFQELDGQIHLFSRF